MSVFEKNRRNEIWNKSQHPYKHDLADFSYANPAFPTGITNIEQALNYIIAVLYPQVQPNVPTPGDLPAGGNNIGDYRIVDDDGDGKSAAYRWEQREGDVAAQWYKIYDVDWSVDGILAAVMDVTNDAYVVQKGKQDLDETGTIIVGTFAGQSIYGGTVAGQNLTLNANSGDGVGAQTGFIQTHGNFRPTTDNIYSLSTLTHRWVNLYLSTNAFISTLTLGTGSIVDSTGTISFDNENLITTGNIDGSIITGATLVADDTVDTVTLVPGSYTDTSGDVNFGASSLTTSGALGAGVTTLTDNAQTLILDPDVGGNGSITSSTGTITFGDENLVTTGTLNVGALTAASLAVDNLFLDGNTLSTTNANGDLILLPNGTGVVDVQKVLETLDVNVTGILTVVGSAQIDDLTFNGNTISNAINNAPVHIIPLGTGALIFGGNFLPNVSGSQNVGSTTALLNDIYLSGGIRDATNEIAISSLLSFRSAVFRDLAQTQPAQDGDSLFWDNTNSVWLASTPDLEITHDEISGLTTGDAGHTQFVMLAGRAGGQTIQGGTAASQNLILESTSHATKGYVFTKDIFAPETNASYSGSWSGTDLGDATHYFRDLYTKGEFKGFRLENFTSGTLPASSGQNVGRVVYATDTNKAYVDTGSIFKVLGVSKFVSDISFDGTVLQVDTNVSSDITDARNAQWQLLDNANNYEILGVKITMTSASNVRVTTTIPLPAGSYRLIGIE